MGRQTLGSRRVQCLSKLPVSSNSSDFRRFRRSTRVRLKVSIKAYGIEAPVTCEGETIVVNLHGALISTATGLNVGMMLDIHVYLTGNSRASPAIVNGLLLMSTGVWLQKPGLQRSSSVLTVGATTHITSPA